MKVRELLAAAIVGALALAGSSGVNAAASRPVAGTLDGTATSAESFCSTGTMSVSGSFDATFIGRGTYAGTITTSACLFPAFCCPGPPSAPYAVDATFVFAGPGGTFTASGAGTATTSTPSAHVDSFAFDLQLTIESGTGRYRRASGILTVNLGVSVFLTDLTAGSFGTIMGTLTPA